MQKWCPEAFSTGVGDETPDSGTVFRGLEGPSAAPADGDDGPAFSFQRETGYTDPRSLLATLTREERADLYELAETDVAGTYEARQKQQEDEYASRLAEAKREAADSLAAWTRDLEAAVRADLSEAAAGAARLAVRIAEKLVRGTVAVDHGVLARALETVLYKQQTASPLRVSASPRDALWLADQADLRARLNIEVVADDRRLVDGDCRVRSDGREWDLTVGGQLEVLAEIIEEAIATRRGAAIPEAEVGPR
jgi:flagellar biosynthesis/type III secretory pathway protein FliH